MKNNSKYTKNKEKWLDIYTFCKTKLYQVNKRIISIISKKINKANNINISAITRIFYQVNKRKQKLCFRNSENGEILSPVE